MRTLKLLLIFTLFPFSPSTTHAQSTVEGDMNHDGVLTITDVMMMIDIIMGAKPLPSFTFCPDDNHPHMIDLGLPSSTKWACCNVDASKPEEYGGYYSWGETEEKEVYEWSTYIHCEGTKTTCNNLGPSIANTQYDVAHVKWGDDWQMPSVDKFRELIDNCTYVWTTYNDVKGAWMVSTINGANIFFPAAGYKRGRTVGPQITCGQSNSISKETNKITSTHDQNHPHCLSRHSHHGSPRTQTTPTTESESHTIRQRGTTVPRETAKALRPRTPLLR